MANLILVKDGLVVEIKKGGGDGSDLDEERDSDAPSEPELGHNRETLVPGIHHKTIKERREEMKEGDEGRREKMKFGLMVMDCVTQN